MSRTNSLDAVANKDKTNVAATRHLDTGGVKKRFKNIYFKLFLSGLESRQLKRILKSTDDNMKV